jgi:hypothetical protein
MRSLCCPYICESFLPIWFSTLVPIFTKLSIHIMVPEPSHQPAYKSKLYYDRQPVGQSVLVSGTHLGPATNFFHSLFDYFLDRFGFVDVGAPSLTRSRICAFQFLSGITSAAFLRSESHGIHESAYTCISPFVARQLINPTVEEFLATERRCIVFPVRYELNLYNEMSTTILCRRK